MRTNISEGLFNIFNKDNGLLEQDSISEGVLKDIKNNINKNFIRAPKNKKFYKENKQFLHKVLNDCHPIVVGELTKIKNPHSNLQHLEFPSNLLSDVKWLENVDIIGNKIKLLVCGFKVSYLEDWEEIEYNKVVDKCNKNSKIKKYGNIIVEKNIIRHGPEDGIYFSYYIIMDRESLQEDFIYENTFNTDDILKEIQPIVDREISKVKFLNNPKGNFKINSTNITAKYDIPWKLVQLYKKVEDQFDESLYEAIDKIRNNSTINKYFKEVYLKLGKLDFKLEFKYKK